ncbi:MAG: hypothetical protein VX747_11735, partial [Actinomycetota bacterium]|nr:hypothetical protein [Actinomycetota bacterium]
DPDPERLWVMAPVMERGRSSVNPCTAWSPGTPGVARFEPEDAGPPMSPGSGTGRAGWWSALVAGLCASLRV